MGIRPTSCSLALSSPRELCSDVLKFDGSSVFAKSSLDHQLLQIFELCLHLAQLLVQADVLVLKGLQLLLCQLQLSLLLLPVPEGGRPVLSLLPLLPVGRVGRGCGWRGRFGSRVLLPGLGLQRFGGQQVGLLWAERGRAPLGVRVHLRHGAGEALGGGLGADDDDDVLPVSGDEVVAHRTVQIWDAQHDRLLHNCRLAFSFDKEFLQLLEPFRSGMLNMTGSSTTVGLPSVLIKNSSSSSMSSLFCSSWTSEWMLLGEVTLYSSGRS